METAWSWHRTSATVGSEESSFLFFFPFTHTACLLFLQSAFKVRVTHPWWNPGFNLLWENTLRIFVMKGHSALQGPPTSSSVTWAESGSIYTLCSGAVLTFGYHLWAAWLYYCPGLNSILKVFRICWYPLAHLPNCSGPWLSWSGWNSKQRNFLRSCCPCLQWWLAGQLVSAGARYALMEPGQPAASGCYIHVGWDDAGCSTCPMRWCSVPPYFTCTLPDSLPRLQKLSPPPAWEGGGKQCLSPAWEGGGETFWQVGVKVLGWM